VKIMASRLSYQQQARDDNDSSRPTSLTDAAVKSTQCTLPSASVQLAFFLIFSYKPARHFEPCRLDFDTPLSSITTLIQQSPLPFRLHSWLPSTNPPYLTLCFITLPFSPLFLPFLLHPPPPPTSFTLSPYSSYICLICL